MPVERKLAPWVKQTSAGCGILLWGPKLTLLELKAARWEDSDREALEQYGFLADELPLVPAQTRLVTAAGATEGVVVSELTGSFLDDLLVALELRTGMKWGYAASVDVYQLRAAAIVLFLNTSERREVLEEIKPLAKEIPIIWSGETVEGPHVGPLFRMPSDVTKYQDATFEWSTIKHTLDMGFNGTPVSVMASCISDCSKFADAVARLLKLQRQHEALWVVTLHDGGQHTEKLIWTSICRNDDFLIESSNPHAWGKGLFSNFERDTRFGAHLTYCAIPAGGDPELEVCGGKGIDAETARISCLGEAIERHSAWLADRGGVKVLEQSSAFSPRAFHPFGSSWAGQIASRYSVEASDEHSGDKVLLPADLCLDRSLHPMSDAIISGSTTSGIAAFTTRDGAILRGALELLERDNFYVNLLNETTGRHVRFDETILHPKWTALNELILNIQKSGAELRLVAYPCDHEIPIVHAFLWEPTHGCMSRGSGSGCSLVDASLQAALEAIQISTQHEFLRQGMPTQESDKAFLAWRSEDVTSHLRRYLATFELDQIPSHEFSGDAHLLNHLKSWIRNSGSRLFCVDYPQLFANWFTVKVLIPGMTVLPEPSDSAGGNKLTNASFRSGVPV